LPTGFLEISHLDSISVVVDSKRLDELPSDYNSRSGPAVRLGSLTVWTIEGRQQIGGCRGWYNSTPVSTYRTRRRQ